MKNIINTHEQGKLITFDWPDGVWKSTVVKLLAEQHWWVYYKTPGEVTMEERDKYDLPEVSVQNRFDFYIWLLMKDAVRIRDILERWNNVFCDRFIISTVAHHKAMDESININWIQQILAQIRIDCSIVLHGDISVLMQRTWSRDKQTRFEWDTELVIKTQENFKKYSPAYLFKNTGHPINTTIANINHQLKELNIY